MVDKELLQAISDMMDNKLDPIKADIADLRQGQAEMKQEQAEMKQDIRKLNQSIAVTESKVLHELKVLNEGLTGWQERNSQIDRLESELEEHDNRIWALEQTVKK